MLCSLCVKPISFAVSTGRPRCMRECSAHFHCEHDLRLLREDWTRLGYYDTPDADLLDSWEQIVARHHDDAVSPWLGFICASCAIVRTERESEIHREVWGVESASPTSRDLVTRCVDHITRCRGSWQVFVACSVVVLPSHLGVSSSIHGRMQLVCSGDPDVKRRRCGDWAHCENGDNTSWCAGMCLVDRVLDTLNDLCIDAYKDREIASRSLSR